VITEASKAVYQVLVEAQGAGQPLEEVPEILDNAMKMAASGGIAVEAKNERYVGGSRNRRDFVTGETAVHCVQQVGRGNDYLTALETADALAKKVRGVLKGNLTLDSAEFSGGFTQHPIRILRTDSGYGVEGGTRVAVATVVVEADYEESWT